MHFIFGHIGWADTDVRSVNTTILGGPIERHKSRLASSETGDGLTGAHSGRSFDRIQTLPKWPRERRARAGRRESSRRDKAMRSMPPFPPENDSLRFCIITLFFYLSKLSSSTL